MVRKSISPERCSRLVFFCVFMGKRGSEMGFENRTFQPEQTATRGQFAKMVAEALGLRADGKATAFTDRQDIPSWAQASAAAAVQAGLLQGYEENGKTFFKASQTITRAEMAVIIANALKTEAIRKGNGNADVSFQDEANIPSWAQSSVKAAVSSGILNGYEDRTFRSSNVATRAEAAAMIYKLLNALNI